MTVDMTQFYQVFFEESSELLAEMETLLLKIDLAAPDTEELNAIFRVAHSIKGGASTFGFTDMTEVTHVLESLLDRVRKGELALTSEMVDVFLRARDVVTGQLAGHRGDGKADPVAAQTVCDSLKHLAGGTPVPLPRAAPAPAVAVAPIATATTAAPAVCYQIQFVIPEAANAEALDKLRTNLAALGKVESVGAPASGATGGNHVWRLVSAAPDTDIWEAMAFAVDPAGLKIEQEAADPGYGFFDAFHAAIVPADPVASPAISTAAAPEHKRRATDAPEAVLWFMPFEHYHSAEAMTQGSLPLLPLVLLPSAALAAGAVALYWYNRRDIAI